MARKVLPVVWGSALGLSYMAALAAKRFASPKCRRTKSCIFLRATFASGASGILDAKLCGIPS
jgi:hypothetical protein